MAVIVIHHSIICADEGLHAGTCLLDAFRSYLVNNQDILLLLINGANDLLLINYPDLVGVVNSYPFGVFTSGARSACPAPGWSCFLFQEHFCCSI
jgi:hypothetical protein